MTWGYDIVRKRNGKKRERQSLERFLAPLEPLEPFEPFEPLEPLSGSKTKNQDKPLEEDGGRCPAAQSSALVL